MAGTTTNARPTRDRGPATTFALAFGAVYLLVGIVGFFITGFDNWVENDTDEFLLWFQINPLHNVVHLLIGGALLAAGSAGERESRGVAMLVGAAYLVVGVVGFFATGNEWNVLALNTADHWLHLGTAAIAFAAVAASGRSHTATPASREHRAA